MTLIRAAEEGDIAALGIIGPAAYAAAYGSLWPRAADLARHLDSFGPRAIAEFLARPGARIWLAEEDGEAVGFLSLLPNSPEPVTGAAGGAEIPRIFLLPNARGHGLGRKLLAAGLDAARAAGACYAWLDAMGSADWAIGAYRKWGFRPIGTTRFPKPVHPHLAEMVVLRHNLRP